MKKCFSFLLVLLSSFVLFAQSLVYTSENLNMRDAPSTSANKVVTIPKHTAVFILETGKEETIGGETAEWVKIICDKFINGKSYEAGQTGWVFSAYLSAEDKYTDQEIEKLLVEKHEFRNSWDDIEPVVMHFSENNSVKTVSIDFGWGDYCSTNYSVQNGKIVLNEPFSGSIEIRDEDLKTGPLTFTRIHSEIGEYCITESFRSKQDANSLIKSDYGISLTKSESVVLPCDCEFYEKPSLDSKKLSFADAIEFKNENKVALIYNSNRYFKGQKIVSDRQVISTIDKSKKGKWYSCNASHTLLQRVWFFVPESDQKNISEKPLSIEMLEDAKKKGSIRMRILTKEEAGRVEGKGYWIDSLVDTYPDTKK